MTRRPGGEPESKRARPARGGKRGEPPLPPLPGGASSHHRKSAEPRRDPGYSNGQDGHDDAQHEPPPPRRRISGSAAVEAAKAHLMDLTQQVPESVSSLSRNRDGWRVVLEVVELERIPRTTDILASYLVELDDEGDLMSYERIHRYYRNEVSGEQ